MADDKNIDDIILWKGSKKELSEEVEGNVQVVSLKLIRLLPFFKLRKHWVGFPNGLEHGSIDSAENRFRSMLQEQGFSGVIHYSLLSKTLGVVEGTVIPTNTSYGCEGYPVIITPRSYRE